MDSVFGCFLFLTGVGVGVCGGGGGGVGVVEIVFGSFIVVAQV